MYKTIFKISKMDCPSEEQLIRMKLNDQTTIQWMDFDFEKRQLTIYHTELCDEILYRLESLKLDTVLVESVQSDDIPPSVENANSEKKLLRQVLGINFFFFVLEFIAGFNSHSMGLVADGLDMLADSLVYALALFAVGGSLIRKKKIARAAGYFQLILAVIGFIETMRRFAGLETVPSFQTMVLISVLALIGNGLCLYLLQKSKSQEAHMRASMIFTSNDILVNLSVIAAGGLVYITNSAYPDLIIGTIVLVIVGKGALKILKLAE